MHADPWGVWVSGHPTMADILSPWTCQAGDTTAPPVWRNLT